jgi:hypothetical protein
MTRTTPHEHLLAEQKAELKRIWTAGTRRRAGLARRTLAELESAIAARGARRGSRRRTG